VRAIGPAELDNLRAGAPLVFLELLLAASKALGFFIRRFISLGLNRVWLRSGTVAYNQARAAALCDRCAASCAGACTVSRARAAAARAGGGC